MASNVKRIPAGAHSVTPHLIIRGAPQAIDFYKKALGAEEVMRAMSPDGKIVLHAEIRIGDSSVYLAEEMPQMGNKSPLALEGTPVVIHLWQEDPDTAFNRAVQAGAKVVMPLADQIWGDRWGMVQDPYGHRWSIACHVRDVSPEEFNKAAAAMFAAKK
jgi:uncharacterized glyoxalase superfamily protein PhnB